MFLADSKTLPTHHKLPNQPTMITTLFPMELHKQPLTLHLIQGHIERALPGNIYVLAIDIIIDLGDLEHQWGL